MITTTHRAFGVEQEHFIFDKNNAPPTPESIDLLWNWMIRDGYKVRGLCSEGTVLSVEQMTDDGPLVVTNDSCTHIIEVAFPKMTCLKRFRKLYEVTWNYLRDKLGRLKLEIHFGGTLSKAPRYIFWRQKETDPKGERLNDFLKRKPIDHPLFCSAFPACFAATQVSLDLPAQEAITKLSYFYSREYLIPIEFSTSKEFQGVKANCVRLLAWAANFHQPYPLLGIPKLIPATLEEYEKMRSQCSGRDYSFVAIRDSNRIEFRSACSQNTVDAVERLVRHRLEIDCKATVAHLSSASEMRVAFEKACHSGLAKDSSILLIS